MSKILTTWTTIGTVMILTACTSLYEPTRLALPLDHGPRATTTPWENKQRIMRAEQGAKTHKHPVM